ncbi:MAG TPA: metal-dependent hydrolase, partial [Clostridiales bacterium]|nr:metal-dependent hydrolase [Clostridiales bacterium]
MTDFTVIYSKRRTICAEIGPDGSVKIRAPQNMRKRDIQEFVRMNEARIVRARQKQ